jgi:hypothetical protein
MLLQIQNSFMNDFKVSIVFSFTGDARECSGLQENIIFTGNGQRVCPKSQKIFNRNVSF